MKISTKQYEKADETKFFLDTSVLIKWINAETENVKQALQVEQDYDNDKIHVAMSLVTWWELGNFLGRTLPKEQASQAMSLLQMKRIPGYALSLEVSDLSFQIMNKHPKTSFYDASQHALAISKKSTFLTCDKKYYEKTKSLGHIKLLKDYS